MPAAIQKTGTESGRRLIKICAAASVVLLASIWIYKDVLPETRRPKFDFAPYYAAWYAARQGLPFYERRTGEEGLHGAVFENLREEMGIPYAFSAYVYPPQIAWLGQWISILPYEQARTAWVWLNAFLWLACVLLLAGRSLSNKPFVVALLIMLSLVYPPFDYSLSLGQINIVLLAAIVAALWFMRGGHECAAGVLLGLASVVKPHLGLFLVYLIWKRRWVGTVSFGVGVLSLTIAAASSLGMEPFRYYIVDVLPRISQGQAYIANQSAFGVLARLFINDPDYLFYDRLVPPDIRLRVLSLIASVILVLTTFVLIPRRRGGAAQMSLEFGAVVACLLLANRVTTIHHFTWMWIAISMFMTLSAERVLRPGAKTMAIFAAGILLILLNWRFFEWFNDRTGAWRLLACNTFVGTLLIWACLLCQIRRLTAVSPPPELMDDPMGAHAPGRANPAECAALHSHAR